VILALILGVIVVQVLILAPKDLGPGGPLGERDQKKSKGDGKKSVRDPLPLDGTGQVMGDFYLVESNADGKEWEMRARRASKPAAGGDWTIEDVEVRFFARDGVTYLVTGDRGTVVPQRNDIRIDGQVETRSSNGHVFQTPSVEYRSSTRRLISRNRVRMLSRPPQAPSSTGAPDLELTGRDMEADLNSNQIEIRRSVRAQKRIDDQRTAVIQAERALFSGAQRMAEFRGDVTIEIDRMKLAGPDARFKYAEDGLRIEAVQVDGGVQVMEREKLATSQSVSIDFLADEVVFSGQPRLVERGDEISGEEIVIRDRGRSVQVRKARAKVSPETANRPASKSTLVE
jgi:lipopolysaccharide export system protein LptA